MAVNISQLIENLKLKTLVKGNLDKEINLSNISRPGLQFAGYYDYFAYDRLQIIGMAEWSFLNTFDKELRQKRLEEFFKFDIPCIILTRNLNPHEELIEIALKNNVTVLQSPKVTTKLVSKITNYLERELAKETTVHGVLVDVYGIGILITGESGIGKSETALELVKRGHRLISDDAVEIKSIDGNLYGRSPYITSGMLEVRGLGIIDIPSLYGLSSISDEKIIDFNIHLRQWKSGEQFDRLGIDNTYEKIIDVKVLKVEVPIRPGRNIAVIIETAAANHRYKSTNKKSPVEIIEKRMDSQPNQNV